MTRDFHAPIALRVFTERPSGRPFGARGPVTEVAASEWTLVFDCETTVDSAQRLRFGFYQVRRHEALETEGIFYDTSALTRAERALLRQYARSKRLDLMTVERFRTHIVLKFGYVRRATVVGFNLPFDLSRLAMRHGPARGGMRGGFSFDLTGKTADPRVRIKHLSPRAALIDFGIPGEQATTRGRRRRGRFVKPYRGRFVDIKTLASALTSRRFSLHSLSGYLCTATRKRETDEHGKVTHAYLDYGRADVQVTWECYCKLRGRFLEHRLNCGPDRMLSEASIGKAYLQRMGIEPFLVRNPSFSRQRFGEMLSAYFGGRAEVRTRRVVCEVAYCDFKSMYPTVNRLMGLWRFVTAEGLTIEDTTDSTQAFLDTVTIKDLRRPKAWRKLCTLVRLRPTGDILPVRSKYDGASYTIGLNRLTTRKAVWVTLADAIVSKLATGRSPRIEKALTYAPGPVQSGLIPTKILGRDDFEIDPTTEDFFARLVDLRDDAKERGDAIEKALKIIANSTSYGIFIEVNRDDAPKSEPLSVYGPDGEHRDIAAKAIEEPGRYFHPLLGVLITGAARLMLGLAEQRVLALGLDWAFCDTDSLAIVRPEGLSRKDFRQRTQQVIEWFEPLNPYKKAGSILKLEDLNCGIGSTTPEPLYCFAISAKRYVLFNLDERKRPIIRKASAHGLGHLLDPYPEAEAPRSIPRPRVSLPAIGVRRWQYDLWYRIVEAAIRGHPNEIRLAWHPGLRKPAAIRYAASSPQLLKWMVQLNAGKPYEQQVRPFGFLLAFMPRAGVFAPIALDAVGRIRRGRPRKIESVAPVAPYDTDPSRAVLQAFDRSTGRPVRRDGLKTYAEVLSQYHLSCEDKFLNGQFRNTGRTERRHVVATEFEWIGKEANGVGESGETSPTRSAVESFATAPLVSRKVTTDAKAAQSR